MEMGILAKANAKKLLKKYFIKDPAKLDLYAIAGYEDLFIEERDLFTSEGQLVVKEGMGIITVDDIIDVLEEEVTEDIHRMVGSVEVYEDKLIKVTELKIEESSKKEEG